MEDVLPNSPQPRFFQRLSNGEGGGGTTNGHYVTKSFSKKSDVLPDDVVSPTPKGCGALLPMSPLQRAAPTEPPQHKTYQRSWCTLPHNQTGSRTGIINSAIYVVSETQQENFCCQSTESWPGNWRYIHSKGPGTAPVTNSLQLPGRNWRIDGSAFSTPPSCTFWCWDAIPPLSTGALKYQTVHNGGESLRHHLG